MNRLYSTRACALDENIRKGSRPFLICFIFSQCAKIQDIFPMLFKHTYQIHTVYFTGKSAIKSVYCTSFLYSTSPQDECNIGTFMARYQSYIKCIARSVTSDIWRECNTNHYQIIYHVNLQKIYQRPEL